MNAESVPSCEYTSSVIARNTIYCHLRDYATGVFTMDMEPVYATHDSATYSQDTNLIDFGSTDDEY